MAFDDGGTRARLTPALVGHIGAYLGYFVVRVLLATNNPATTFPDSSSYALNGSKTVRPYGISALFSLLGTPDRRVAVQTVIASLCWMWLFYELRTSLRRTRIATVCSVGLALATLSAPISLWDGDVLSESLALGAMAALCATWLRFLRRQDTTSTLIASATVAVSALVRETVFLVLAVPVALAIAIVWVRKQTRSGFASNKLVRSVAPVVLSVAFLLPLSLMALRPGDVLFAEGASLTSFRTMNVIGQRILPDPYLREEMQRAGLPEAIAANPDFHKGRFSMDDDWKLFRSPELVRFAEEFPTSSFLIAEFKRPRTFAKFASAAFDRRVWDGTATNYGSNRLIPNSIGLWLWGWSAWLHLGVFFALLTTLVLNRVTRFLGPTGSHRGVAVSALTLAAIMAGGAVLAHSLDAMERSRHVLPFWVFGRLALGIGGIVIATAALRNPAQRAWSFIRTQADRQNRRALITGIGLGLVAPVLAFVLVATIRAKPESPSIRSASASSALVRKVETTLRTKGVRVTPGVRTMLGVLLRPWEERPDLKAAFSTPNGEPDVGRLSGWMRSLPDASAEGFLPYLGDLEELRGRMGLLSADSGIAPVLYWSIQNANLDRDVSGVMWHVVEYCRAYPNVQTSFTTGEQVDVVGLLAHISGPGAEQNPTAATDSPVLAELIASLR